MISSTFLTTCISRAQQANTPPISPTTPVVSHPDSTTDVTDNPPQPLPQDSDTDFEAKSYYYGLPSEPVSVYHTGATWKRPTGPDAQCVPKEARPICKHPIADVWGELGPQVPKYLDSVNVKWTTIDVTRFAEVGKDAGPVFLWVGVVPGSLSRENAEVAAIGCKKLLKEFEITDVEVAFRESLFTRSASPQLLKHVSSAHPTADIRSPLTPALGLQIAARATPYIEGTGGIYICEGDKVFLLTARHVVIPPVGTEGNKLYSRKNVSQPRRDVLLLGSEAFQNELKAIKARIGFQYHLVSHYRQELQDFGEADTEPKERKRLEDRLQEAEEAIDTLKEFYTEVEKCWSTESQRVLGHIAHSPPISVNTSPKGFTEDWALIELNDEKINWNAFKGNVIDLGTKILAENFTKKMYPHPKAQTSFKYPKSRLLQLQGIIQEDELRHPTMLDANGEECLLVIKNGKSTGVTIGRATGIMSFVRQHLPGGAQETSMELAIYSYDHQDGPFSAPGDSGSIIADGKGRVAGLLIGGTGLTKSTDVTYATPFFWLFDQRIKDHFPNAYLYPNRTYSESQTT